MPTDRIVIERGVPLSQSFIWKLQARFYQSLGIDAWLSGIIPSKITTNAFIAQQYARLIAAYLHDLKVDNVVILELGAGHGRFGFLCAQALRELDRQGLLPGCRWRYVLTDVAERNIEYWMQHPAFQPLARDGYMDFARYEAGVDQQIELRRSGQVLGRDYKTGHLVIIGNYFFDSLPIDVLQMSEGTLCHQYPVLSVASDATCRDPEQTEIIEQLSLAWESQPATAYESADLRAVVDVLRDNLDNSAFTIPVGACDTLAELDSWAAAGSLVLTADKGYTHLDDLRGRPLPTMVQHGCFSFSVNFRALAEWFEFRGGSAWLPAARDGDLEVSAFTTRRREDGHPRLSAAFEEVVEFTPGDFHQLSRRAGRNGAELRFRECLSLLKLGNYEPYILHAIRRDIRRELPSASSADRQRLRGALQRVEQHYFHLDREDICFDLALIYEHLDDSRAAVPLYRRSLELFGDDATTYLNLAGCLMRDDRTDEALEAVDRALQLDPCSEDARVLQSRLHSAVEAFALSAEHDH